MQQSKVAIRYAEAFFDLTIDRYKDQSLDELNKQKEIFAMLTQVLQDSKEISNLVDNPTLTGDKKKELLKKVLVHSHASVEMTNFLYLLLDKRRFDILPQIVWHFNCLLDKKQGVSRGILTTAIVIGEDKRMDILQKLEKQTGRKLVVDFEVDSSLLGGIVLTLGDETLDSSLKNQLNKINQLIKRGGGE